MIARRSRLATFALIAGLSLLAGLGTNGCVVYKVSYRGEPIDDSRAVGEIRCEDEFVRLLMVDGVRVDYPTLGPVSNDSGFAATVFAGQRVLRVGYLLTPDDDEHGFKEPEVERHLVIVDVPPGRTVHLQPYRDGDGWLLRVDKVTAFDG
jgi:hypothetical protein